MASAKSRRYGMGGMKHKKVTQAGRPNGKAWKSHPKGFAYSVRSLVTVKLPHLKGVSF
jgi:hypothetical protein